MQICIISPFQWQIIQLEWLHNQYSIFHIHYDECEFIGRNYKHETNGLN